MQIKTKIKENAIVEIALEDKLKISNPPNPPKKSKLSILLTIIEKLKKLSFNLYLLRCPFNLSKMEVKPLFESEGCKNLAFILVYDPDLKVL